MPSCHQWLSAADVVNRLPTMSHMTDRQPEPWETNAPAPFLTMERTRGTVAVSALGGDRFLIEAPEQAQTIVGFPAARKRAHALARELD